MDITETPDRRIHYMESHSTNQLPHPKQLKTLCSNIKYSRGNNILHQFVLDNSDPNNSGNANYINAVLLSMSDVSVNALNDAGYSALHLAVLKNNLLMVQKLLSCLVNIDVNAKCNFKNLMETALHLAVRLGHLSIIEELLNKGADVNMKNRNGNTALFLAAKSSELDILKLLVSKGADLDAVNKFKETILKHAVDSGNLATVEFLISKGADINVKSANGRTLLHFAVMSRNFAAVELLISKGANINAIENHGNTPLHLAISSLEMLGFLARRGADWHVVNKGGRTPLDYAMRVHNSEVIKKMLLDQGVDLHV